MFALLISAVQTALISSSVSPASQSQRTAWIVFCQMVAHGRTQLEAVPETTTGTPHIAGFRMTVNDQMPVRTGLVLADAYFEQRCRSEARKPARPRDPFGRWGAISGVWVEGLAESVIGDLETTLVNGWHPVVLPLIRIDPYR